MCGVGRGEGSIKLAPTLLLLLRVLVAAAAGSNQFNNACCAAPPDVGLRDEKQTQQRVRREVIRLPKFRMSTINNRK
jgi:hypothetical protein